VSWPKGFKAKGEIRTQYAHIIDMVPTALDLLDMTPPAAIRGVTQAPIHGISFAHTLEDAAAESHRHTQYFEMFGHRSIYHDGWRAVCPWPGPSFTESAPKEWGEPITSDTLAELDATGWELYHVEEDFAENHDVAAEHRDKLIAMIGTWYVEAGKYDVMPIDGSALARLVVEKPLVARPRDRYIYRPGTQSVPFFAGPRVLNRPHSITADVEIPDTGAEGVLLSQGTAAGGYSLFLKGGKLRYVHNYVGRALYTVESEGDVPAGKHELRFEFEPTGEPDMTQGKGAPGRLQLYVDGSLVGNAEVPVTTPFVFNPGALTCGANPGSPVTDEYTSPFKFTGTLHTVTVDVSGDLIHDPESELRAHMARQ
jgi:arylsulfatase